MIHETGNIKIFSRGGQIWFADRKIGYIRRKERMMPKKISGTDRYNIKSGFGIGNFIIITFIDGTPVAGTADNQNAVIANDIIQISGIGSILTVRRAGRDTNVNNI